MVNNEDFRAALDRGERDAHARRDPIAAVLGMVGPTVEAVQRHVENGVAYQRELLFGAPAEKYRTEGLVLVARLESMIAERLVAAAGERGVDAARARRPALLAGRSVFAVLHLILARPSTGPQAGDDGLGDLRDQIAQIVAGFFAAIDTRAGAGRTAPR
ncbi:hypothetical protein [Nocardia sp. NPDC050710]|uniref:hypothetical protein n=1 Tax=Nocardia sp. NPDC050710 TaxID=3157220 RepID=UPI0033D8C429